MRKRSWTEKQLRDAVASSTSIRQVLSHLGLREAGGNYAQLRRYIVEFNLDTSHFRGKAWNKGMKGIGKPRKTLEEILVVSSTYTNMNKLKQRLFKAGLKFPMCEECGWKQSSPDGRIPVELDHINGNRQDNRLENLRILCPNCHSLKPTHRGRNIGRYA